MSSTSPAPPFGAALVTQWVFRHAGGALIDFPDLPTPVDGIAQRWIATLWPDALAPHGWGVQTWHAAQRGFWCPNNLAMGDVIEFGIAAVDESGLSMPAATRRWYGWLDRATPRALIVYGPYPSAQAACLAAMPTVDLVRLNELVGPSVSALADLEEERLAWPD